MLLGEKIKKIRDLKGMTQEDIASKLNISSQAYSKIERNETKIDEKRLEQIANALDVPAESIQKFDESNFFISNLKECENSQSLGMMNTVNNYYYNTDQVIPVLENLVELQKKQLKQQSDEIEFLRKQLESLLRAK
jgi:transcriptional regulator with XRE-family HTH domain